MDYSSDSTEVLVGVEESAMEIVDLEEDFEGSFFCSDLF